MTAFTQGKLSLGTMYGNVHHVCVGVFVCMSVYLPAHLFISVLSVFLSAYVMCVYWNVFVTFTQGKAFARYCVWLCFPCVCVCVCGWVCLHVYLSVCLPTCLPQCIRLSVCLRVCVYWDVSLIYDFFHTGKAVARQYVWLCSP